MSSHDTALTSTPGTARGGRASTALLKLQADERLVAHVRRGNEAAFEVLVARYQARLLAFCRHMLGSSARRDAEDVLQEVFTSAYRAMLGDTRPINVRPWLYRIARNRCLNHLRRDPMPSIEGMEMTVVDERIGTAETVHQRAEVRQLLSDIQALPETQRTAILLREIDDLSYEQIALAMDNTVAAVKSLLVRARVGLAEAAESRRLSCDEVRFELGQHAEGLVDKLTPPTRRHLKDCGSCAAFQQDLKDTNKALAMLAPAFGLLLLAKTILGGSHAGSAAAGGAGAAAASSGGLISIGGVLSAKTMTGLAAAVAVTGAAVEVKHVTTPSRPAVTERQQARAGGASQAAAAPAATTVPSGGVVPLVATTPESAKAKAARSDEPEETTPGTTPDDPNATTPAEAEFPVVSTPTTPATTSPTTPTIEDRTGTAELPEIEDRTDEVQVRPPVRLPIPVPPSMRPQPPTTPAAPAPAPAAPSTPPASVPAPTPAPEPVAPVVPSTPDVPAPTTVD
ncbi:MAG: sigma-70 family RNA polymerase sigma factor [Solirubrobacteraceae bacterium]|nr:sigma-70 family RNA polymerase sigma factor [Solirubrobacteraceae bacterium]